MIYVFSYFRLMSLSLLTGLAFLVAHSLYAISAVTGSMPEPGLGYDIAVEFAR
jgi:hypothetical protein